MDQDNKTTNPQQPQQTDAVQPTSDATNQINPTPATPDQQAQVPDYIEEVGGDMIGLLDEVNGDDTLIQKVADEMELDKDKIKSILTPLLHKIDQGQITVEEIALIMASTVVDEEDVPAQETK
jgi:hypothetical protein